MFRLIVYIVGMLLLCLTKQTFSGNLDIIEDTKLPNVTEDTKLPNVTEDTKLPNVTEDTKLPNVTEDTKLPNVTEDTKLPNVTEDTKLSVFAYEMCPYTSFCRLQNSSAPEGYYSCCEECSCSDDCHLANKCCPDAEIRNTNSDLTCKYQFEYFDVHRNIFIEPKYPTYFIVDTCDNTTDKYLVNGYEHPTDLEDHILVSDSTTSIIYKNGKCAQCNGVQIYETWDLRVLCPFDEALLSLERRTKYALEHCSFVSRPPKNMEHLYEPMRCSPEVIGVCNVTGEWDFYDEDLERACSKYNMVYKEEYLTPENLIISSRFYKNIYCYLCNNKRETKPNGFCIQGIQTERVVPDLAPFSTIFSNIQQPVDKSTCDVEEIQDPFTGDCIHLYCPFGEAAVHGKCVVIMQETSVSLSAIYKLDITAPQTDQQNQEVSSMVFQTLVNDIQTKFSKTGCEICNIFMFTEHVVLIRASPSASCAMSRLLKVYKYMAQMMVSSQADNKINIHIRQTNNYTLVQNGRYLSIQGLERIHQYKGRTCRVGIYLTTKFFCERITYSEKDLAVSGVSQEIIQKLLVLSDPYETNENVVDEYLICLSDYKRIKNASTKNGFWLPLSLVWLIVMVSL